MLDQWLAPLALREFVGDYLGRRPLVRPGTAKAWVPLFDRSVLDRLLRARPAPDVVVARDGQLLPVRSPRNVAECAGLMRAGFGITVRKVEQHDPELAELARTFATELPSEVRIQLHVTPAGTQTFGWHFDEEDAFIIQTLGSKEYRFRENTVASRIPAGARPDFTAVRRETSRLFAAELIAGDWLYIPSRWWHLVRSIEDSLSISIGVVPALPRMSNVPSHQGRAQGDLREAERQET